MGGTTRVVVVWVWLGVVIDHSWISLIGVACFMGVSLRLGLCLGFGCGSVIIGVTPDIGCVWLTMQSYSMWLVA